MEKVLTSEYFFSGRKAKTTEVRSQTALKTVSAVGVKALPAAKYRPPVIQPSNRYPGSFAVHSGFGLTLTCKGDLEVDGHHSVEDCGIALGQALAQCVGDKAGIARFGQAFVPMDEALGFCALDISGRPYLVFDAPMPQPMCGQYDTCLTVEFMRALAVHAGLTLHLKCEYGENAHHITEALFKALARALKQAVAVTGGGVLSAKGVL